MGENIQKTILILSIMFLALNSVGFVQDKPQNNIIQNSGFLSCFEEDIQFPLHHYTRNRDHEKVQCLLKKKYPVNIENAHGTTALWLALSLYDGENSLIINTLLEHQPLADSRDVNVLLSNLIDYIDTDEKPKEAVVRRYVELAKKLINLGADISEDSGIMGLSVFINFVTAACEKDISSRFDVSRYFSEILREQQFSLSDKDADAISHFKRLGNLGLIYDTSCITEAKKQIAI